MAQELESAFVMALMADEGLALFAGLNVFPQKSYLSEYSSRISHTKTTQLLAAWHDQVNPDGLFDGASFNLDFHSVPYYGEDPVVERHYVSARSRRQPSILAFLAQGRRWPRLLLLQWRKNLKAHLPICAKAKKPRRSSTLSLSGNALTENCPAIWSSIPV